MDIKWLDGFTLKFGEYQLHLGTLIGLVAIVVGVWWLSLLVERLFNRAVSRYATGPEHVASLQLVSRIARYAVWLLGTLVGLNYIGIDLSSVAILGGAIGVGLGFGLQNIFSNFISGVIIMLERSLKIGDFVDLESGVRGHVREIAMRYTRVTTNDSLDVLVPNSEFINGKVTNWTLHDADRRMHVPFGVAYGTPKEQVRAAGLAAAKSAEFVIDAPGREPQVWLVEYGDSSVNYELVVWVGRQSATSPAGTHAKLMWLIDDELGRAGIEIPFPQRDLHVRSGELKVRWAGDDAPRQSRSATEVSPDAPAGDSGQPSN